ncbi:MAG: hypothetical protein GXY67_07220 [Clostridiales bacterium]|nr:hypothetical protein [Clostridiales bacterium]
MMGKGQAAAQPLFSAGPPPSENSQPARVSPSLETWAEPPPEPNVFTPISVEDRLRNISRRSVHLPSSLPPMQPGQRYSYGSIVAQETEDVRQYQQDYWSQLQNQPYPAAEPQEMFAPVQPAIPEDRWEAAALLPIPPRTIWDEDFPLQPLQEEPPEDWPSRPWEQEERTVEGWLPEGWLPEDMVYAPNEEQHHVPEQESPPPRLSDRLRKAFALSPNPEPSKARLFRTAAVGLMFLLLVFCLLQVGRMVLSMLQNDREMKAVRENYYAQAGVELARDAARVELLPYGVTFAPTATPQPMDTALAVFQGNPEGLSAVENAPEHPALTPSRRTKATEYPDNPLRNIREAFLGLRAENPDIVGRLTIDGLVDETVVMRNNTYYLTHNANGSFSETGAVFVDEACSLKNPPENLLLRGQGTVTGKLLEPLWNYRSQNVDFVRQHAFLRMETLYEAGEYVLFAVIVTDSGAGSSGSFNYAGYPSFPSDEEMDSYVSAAKALSLYEIPVEVQSTDRLLTLSTVGDPRGETLVLMARKLRQGETATSHLLTLQSLRAR